MRCPNLDNRCKNKEDYMMCAGGEYNGKCMEANAACAYLESCSGENAVLFCREYIPLAYLLPSCHTVYVAVSYTHLTLPTKRIV